MAALPVSPWTTFMNSPNTEDDLLGRLAEEWCRRVRDGERPDLSEYTDKYPELADEIRDLFPAMAMVEDLKPSGADASSTSGGAGPVSVGKALERLGDFRILREVGRGGMGVVYEAEQESLGRYVALKILPAHFLNDPEKKKRFQREAKATARLHHTNIVPVYGVGEHDGMQYYVMQFINGLGLDEVLAELKRLRRAKSSSQAGPATVNRPQGAVSARDLSAADVARSLMTGDYIPGMVRDGRAGEPTTPPRGAGSVVGTESAKPRLASTSGVTREPSSGSGSSTSAVYLPGQAGQSSLSDTGRHYWQSVAHIGHQVAEALEYANSQGIIHRDIKPSNLLLDTQGTVWVTDFGLAKATADGDNLTHTGDIVGTLRYMAPERFKGQADARGDIYSLGLTLYELLTQRPAFDEKDRSKLIHRVTHEEPTPPRRINPGIPRDLETIVLKAIDREPGRRYQTAAALADDLKRFVEDKPVQARRVSPMERFWRWCRRNPALALSTGLAAAALVAVTILSITFNISQSRANQKTEQALTQSQKLAGDLALEKQNLAREQSKTKDALAKSQKLAGDLAAEKKNLAAEQTRTKAALAKSQQLARILSAEEKRVKDALNQTRHLSAKLLIERGQGLLSGRAPALGMLWLARGLEMAPADAEDLQTIARINLASMRNEIPVLRAVVRQPTPFEILAVAFSPDGKTILTGGRDKNARLWDAATGKRVGPPLVNEGWVSSVAFSPDGKWALTGNWGWTARLWDAATGKPIGEPFRHPEGVQAVAFSPDGKTILTSCKDNKSRLWVTATGKMIGQPLENHHFNLQDSPAYQVAFSPDGKTVLTGCPGREVRLWEAATGKPIGRPLVHSDIVYRAAFSPDGKTVLTGCFDTKARLWDAATGKLLGSALDHGSRVVPVAFHPDGKAVLTATIAGIAQLWDPRTGNPIGSPMQHGGLIWTADFCPDGRLILTASQDGTARLWDADTGEPLGQPLMHPVPVKAAHFGPGGRTLVTVGADGLVRLWELPSGQLFQAPLVHRDQVMFVAFSPNGKTVLTGGGDRQGRKGGAAQLWDTATGRPIGAPLSHLRLVIRAAFSPDGKRVATASWDNTARIWDATTGQAIGPALTHQAPVTAVAFSPDGTKVLTGSQDRTARLWDARTGQPIGPPLGNKHVVLAVAFSPDGKTAATGHQGNRGRLWDVGTGQPLGEPLDHAGVVSQVVFSPDGTKVLTASLDKTARLWDARTGKPLGPPMQHQAPVSFAFFSGDGLRILTAGDRLARVWETATGRPVGPPMQHPEIVTAAAISADGRTVLTGSRDHGVRLWHASTGQSLGRPLTHQGAVMSVAFSPDGKLILTGSEDKTARLWRMPAPVQGAPARLGRWVEVCTGFELTAEGSIQLLDGPGWQRQRTHLEKAGGPPTDGSAEASDSAVAFHRQAAAEAAASGHWFASAWHHGRVIAAQPSDWFAYALRSKCYLKLGRRDRAADDCARALKLGPPDTVRDWFGRQSPDYEADATWETALWYLDQLVKASPQDGLAHALRTKAQLELGNREKAAADFARALERGPREEVLAHYRSNWEECDRKEQWQTMLWYLDRLVKEQPRDAYLHARRGKALGRLGQFRQARQAYDQAVQWGAAEEGVWQITAVLRLHFGDLEGYRKLCNDMRSRFGADRAPGQDREIVIRTGTLGPADAAGILEVARKLVTQYPRVTMAQEAFGMSLYRAGQYAEAIKRLNAAVQGTGGTTLVHDWFFLAMAHHRLGHAEEARKWLAQGLEWLEQSTPDKPRDSSMGAPIIWDGWLKIQLVRYEAEALIKGSPANVDLQERLAFARAHVRLGQYARAVADFDKALQQAAISKMGEVWVERSRCQVQLKQWDRAAGDLARAARLEPDNLQTLVMLGQCYRELKQPDKAVGVMAQVVDLRRAAFEKTPSILAVREALSDAYRELAGLQRSAAKTAQAVATLLEIRKLWPGHAARLHETARQLAECAASLDGDPKKAATQQAMAALQEALLAGYADVAALQNDPAFKPLRSLDEYQAILNQLRASDAFPAPTGEIRRFKGHTHNWVQGVAISRDGRLALSGGFGRIIRLWDVATGKEVRRLEGHTGEVCVLDFSVDGRRAVSGGTDGIRLWNIATGKQIRFWKTNCGLNQRAVFSPDGKRILGQVLPSTLCLWDAGTGQEIRRFEGQTTGSIQDLAYAANGQVIVSGGDDGTLRIWEAQSGKELHPCEGNHQNIRSVAIAQGGGLAASGGSDGMVCLWDTHTGRLVRRLEGSWNWVRGLAFSPDGHQLLSADQGGNLILWQVATGKELHRFRPGSAGIRVVFAADGSRALSVGDDGLVRLWNLSLGAARARDLAKVGRATEADAEYARAIQVHPRDTSILFERGVFFARRGHWPKAVADVNKAVELNPNDAQTLSRGADFFRTSSQRMKALGQTKEARQHWQQGRKMSEKLLASQPDYATFAEELADFLLADRAAWTVLDPVAMTSAGGAVLTRQPDGSILASGTNPIKDTYTIVARTDRGGITAILLEALPDISLPHGGSGRAAENGNMALSEFTVSFQPIGGPARKRAVVWKTASSDHEIAAADHYRKTPMNIGLAIDGDPGTYWETWPKSQQAHYAVFVPQEPIGHKGAVDLQIQLVFHNLNHHNLGRFRLSVTTQPQPLGWRTMAGVAILNPWTRLGAAYYQLQKWPAALGALQKAGKSGDGDGYSSLLLSLVHSRLGKPVEARKWLDQGLGWMAKNAAVEPLNELAVEALTAVIAQAPNNVSHLTHRAHLAARLGNRDQAARDYRKAAALAPSDDRWPARLAQLQPDVIAFWNFDSDPNHWQAAGTCKVTKTPDGLRVTSTGSDPFLTTKVSAVAGWKEITIRARLKDPIVGRVFWGKKGAAALPFTEIRSQWFAMPPSATRWRDHKVQFYAAEPFDHLRFDPGSTGSTLEIDSMTLRQIDGKDGNAILLRQATAAAALWPKDLPVRFARGDLYLRQGQLEKAVADFKAASQLDAKKALDRHRLFADEYEKDVLLALAAAHVEQVAPAEPDKAAQAASWFRSGSLWARAQDWKQATAAFTRGLELNPAGEWQWYISTSLFLQTRDKKGYIRHCRAMLKRFQESADLGTLDRCAKSCLIGPEEVADVGRLVKLSERVVAGAKGSDIYHWFLQTRGMAEYRAGRFQTAVEWLEKSSQRCPKTMEGNQCKALTNLFLAMAYARLEPAARDKARKALDQALEIVGRDMPKAGSADFGSAWYDWLHIQIVRPEAEEVVKRKAPEQRK
jgi:WD40 repeat protein/serine/threonine protein kinase/Flp pilus assembly protein TadD